MASRHVLQVARRWLERLATGPVRKPRLALAAALLSAAGAAWVAGGLEFDSSYYALLPSDDPRVVESNRVRELTGGNRQLIVAIGGRTPLGDEAEARLAFARELRPRIEALPTVRRADLELPVDFLREGALWLVDDDQLDELVTTVDSAARRLRRAHHPLALGLDEERDAAELDAAWDELAALDARATGQLPEPLLESSDGRYLFMQVTPNVRVMDMAGTSALFAGIEQAVDSLDPTALGLEVRLAGKFAMVRDQHRVMTADLQRASLLALVLCTGIVALFARRLSAPLVVAAGVVVGLCWTLALAELVVGRLSILTGLLVPVLLGLGIDFGIHLVVRYRQERSPSQAGRWRLPAVAAERAARGLVAPSLFAALTTAAALLALTLSGFRGFDELGVLAAGGVLLTLVSGFLTVPPTLRLLDERRARTEATHSALEPPSVSSLGWLGNPPRPATGPARPRRDLTPLALPAAIVVIVGLGALAVFGATRLDDITFQNDYRMLAPDSDRDRDSDGDFDSDRRSDFFAYVDEQLGAAAAGGAETLGFRFDPTVVIVPTIDDARRVGALIEERRAEQIADKERPLIASHLSAADLVPNLTPGRADRIDELREILAGRWLDRAPSDLAEAVARGRRLANAEPWGLDEVPQRLASRLLTAEPLPREGEHGVLVLIWGRERIESDDQALAWAAEIGGLRDELASAGIYNLISTETVMPAWVHELIVSDAPTMWLGAALAVLLLVALSQRSLGRTLLVCLPLAVGVLSTVAIISLADLDLNMFNLIAIPCAIGIGIDDVIHMVHRYGERRRNVASGPPAAPVFWTLRRTGVAVLLTTLTTAFGFGATLVAHHAGLRSLGTLSVIAVGSVFAAALLFLPALLLLVERFRGRPHSSVGRHRAPELESKLEMETP